MAMDEIITNRRRFLGAAGTAALAVGATQLGVIGSAQAQARAGGPASLAVAGFPASFGPVRQIDAGVLNVGYVEAGRPGGSRSS